jgi:hypothetical protein
MSVTQHLVFDPTNASDSANVGAYNRDSSGALIDGQTINSTRWLQVASALFDGAGTALTSTLVSGKQGLDVNLIDGSISVDLNGIYDVSTNPTPDNVGLIGFSRTATPGLSDQIFKWTGAVASSDAVVAANAHAMDVNSFLMGYNGTTWDRLQVDGSKFLKVSVQNSITTSDAALANTAVTNGATSVGTSAVSLVTSALSGRKYLYMFNNASKAMYIGTTGVTSANGFPMYAGQAIELRAGAAIDLKVISTAASQDSRYMELS